MQLDDIFVKGAYIGKSLSEVIKESPSFVMWCADNLIIDIDDHLYDIVKERSEQRDKELKALYSNSHNIQSNEEILACYNGA